jgi:hypothetical protein
MHLQISVVCFLYMLNGTLRYVCMHVQVDPNFDEACAALRKNAGDNEVVEYENFLTVYIPMKRNLLRAFDATLNVITSSPRVSNAAVAVTVTVATVAAVAYLVHMFFSVVILFTNKETTYDITCRPGKNCYAVR